MDSEVIRNFICTDNKNDKFQCKRCGENIQFYPDATIEMGNFNLSCHLMRCKKYQEKYR